MPWPRPFSAGGAEGRQPGFAPEHPARAGALGKLLVMAAMASSVSSFQELRLGTRIPDRAEAGFFKTIANKTGNGGPGPGHPCIQRTRASGIP